MNKNKIRIFLLIIFILVLFVFPNYTKAETVDLQYKKINETSTLSIDGFNFEQISFKDFSNTSKTFGLVGIIENTGDISKNFIATAKFYDKEYNLLATLSSNQYMISYERNSYGNIGSISQIKEGYTVDDIYYYSLSVSTNKTVSSSVESSNNNLSSKYDYFIDSYNIDMIVNENNTFDIIETITAYFNVSKHGIFRKIPLKNTVNRLDGTKSNNRAQITNISVSEDYTTSNETGYKVIKIGDANKTIKGSHTYTIKYTYNIGKDPLKDADELYFNLIGDQWETTISNISFSIKMPKEFDKTLLGFSSGKTGSTSTSNVEYSVIGNTITGKVKTALNPKEALTIRLSLPEGYFVGAGHKIDGFSVFTIIICLVFILIADKLWRKYGKDEQVIEAVEFYPPEGYNSAEIGYLYEGRASNESIISLLIYLADKGYLRIEETEEKVLFLKSNGFRITKLKEYDGDNEIERIFFYGLFSGSSYKNVNISKAREIMKEAKLNGEKLSFQDALDMSAESTKSTESVTESDLYNEFYTTLNRIASKLNSKENKNRIFEKASTGKGKWLIFMIIAIFLLITIKPVLEFNGSEGLFMLPFALIFPGVGFSVLFGMVFGKTPIPLKIFGFIWGLGFGGGPWAFMVLPSLLQNTFYLMTYVLGLVCIAVLIMFVKIMPKRTPFGNEMLGKIRGFKRFLETAEKLQLESLVMENPEYFYNILPYTYALGVSDTWINQFESIALQAPNWYDSPAGFSTHTFGTFMRTTMASATTAMSSSPSSSSSGGGGSSGGGSSGGGSGGGGGGSW